MSVATLNEELMKRATKEEMEEAIEYAIKEMKHEINQGFAAQWKK